MSKSQLQPRFHSTADLKIHNYGYFSKLHLDFIRLAFYLHLLLLLSSRCFGSGLSERNVKNRGDLGQVKD